MAYWTATDMPDQSGRIAIVTGGNSGLGYETALALARKGTHVIVAGRNREKVKAACSALTAQAPGAAVEPMTLDLANLGAIADFAGDYRARHTKLDLLINNAGLMATPRLETADGFEMQLGVNHLGHFALTGRLLDLLLGTPGSRVVTVSSGVGYRGRINFDDLQGERTYSRFGAYAQSKLANFLFAIELERRFRGWAGDVSSLAAHPGYAATNLQASSADANRSRLEGGAYRVLNKLVAQGADMGALPQLYAAAAPQARGGEVYGPDRLGMRGYPMRVNPPPAATDPVTAARLWEISEQLTGVRYPAAMASSVGVEAEIQQRMTVT
jgi:NAD(P)-dependent dehydrogenase (short-subunit alcohol dehydrogenase family)